MNTKCPVCAGNAYASTIKRVGKCSYCQQRDERDAALRESIMLRIVASDVRHGGLPTQRLVAPGKAVSADEYANEVWLIADAIVRGRS